VSRWFVNETEGTSHGHFDTQDSPRPKLGGSHHLPPYSILYVSLRRLHPNGFFSRDSQVGVPKLSRAGVPGLWTLIAPRPELGSGRSLNQRCSSCWQLSNAVSHSLRRRREEVDSRLLMVGSQTGSLTPGPSFAHNLGWKCLIGPCEAILGIYTSRPFHWYKKRSNARRFDLSNRLLSFQESHRTPFSHFWECELHSHIWPQSGVATHKLLCHFMHLKLALHKLISGKICVFLMYMYSWDTGIWCPSSLWCSSLSPPCQQGAFFFCVERTKRLWHDCLGSSSPGNRTWTKCESISLNYLSSGRNFRCHSSFLCRDIGRAKRSSRF
jgi:hypothetical protein